MQYGRQLLSKALLMMEETIRHLAFKYVLICLQLEYISYSAATAHEEKFPIRAST